MFVFGQNIKAGVVGGVQAETSNGNITGFKAAEINSQTGGTTGDLDISFEESLVSVGKTLATAVGVPQTRIDTRINGGKVITGALNL